MELEYLLVDMYERKIVFVHLFNIILIDETRQILTNFLVNKEKNRVVIAHLLYRCQ